MKILLRVLSISALLALVAASGYSADPAPTHKIPGINADDPHAQACVDCHVKTDAADMRFSALMAKWIAGADPKLVAYAKAVAPDSTKITGKHPTTSKFTNIPDRCFNCHSATSKDAPPFSGLMHLVHLSGGDQNAFVSKYGGDCTNCHKLDLKTGKWAIPSGDEK